MENKHGISIWFFIGAMLTAYGILITGAGLYGLAVKPDHDTVLSNLHPGIWWGAIMLALGLFYVIKFRPEKKASAVVEEEAVQSNR